MRSALKFACPVGVFLSLALPNIASAEMHLLAIGSCPPWKQLATEEDTQAMMQVCEKDVTAITSALTERFGLSADNTTTLLQETATVDNLYRSFEALAQNLDTDDTLVVYQIAHGSVLAYAYKGYPASGEVFGYYSEEQPSIATAVEDGYWLAARDLRDAIYDLGARTGADIVAIIESCHASAANGELVHNPKLDLDGDSRISFLFSSGAGEQAHFTNNFGGGLFTARFTEALSKASSGDTLDEVFSVARRETHRDTLAACQGLPDSVSVQLRANSSAYFNTCIQEPEYFDPSGLMLNVAVP